MSHTLPPLKLRRGFASMSVERRTEIARKGGAAVPSDKRSFARNPELAATAGRAGGQTPRRPKAEG